ncbi:MAG: HK97 gp10 family phage protein [Atopobium sp.]|jgi:HK97 gp10 family phage protein
MAASKAAGLTASDMSGLVEVQQDNTEAIQDAIFCGIMESVERIGLVAEGYAKAKCPVDTGRLRNSITHVLKGGISPAVYIGTNVEYGKYVEEGTSKHDAQPFLKPAATEHGSEYKAILQESLGH